MSEPHDGREHNLDMVDFLSRWNEMKAEEILVDSFHELRNPIYVMQGYIAKRAWNAAVLLNHEVGHA